MYIKLIFLCLIFESICGDNIAQRLIDRYNDVRKDCKKGHQRTRKPAYECSGLLIRGVSEVGGSQLKYAWSKKESNIRRNAFSVSFLRRDQRFNMMYDSGFIYYPHLNRPKGKNSYRVFCAFPLNAFTKLREGRHGCGKMIQDTTEKSGTCETQGFTSLTKWTKHFDEIRKTYIDSNYGYGKYQCSFDMTTRDAAKSFALVLEAKNSLQQISWDSSFFHNELEIRAWNEDHPEKLPIEAFFYMLDEDGAKDEAFGYQRDYLDLTGETIPVVGIRLPDPEDPDSKDLVVEYEEPKTDLTLINNI